MATNTFPTFPTLGTFPSVDFSKLELPKLDFSKLGRPNLPNVDAHAVVSAVKDAGYITVGLTVLAAQKAQVRRQELKKSLEGQVGNSRAQMVEIVEARLASLDKGLIAIESKLDGAVEQLEKRLPERAATVVGQAHEATKVVRQQIRNLVVPAV